MTNASTVRSEIVAFLRRELIGPDPRPEFAAFNGGDEILRPQDPPRLRYSAGILFPTRTIVADQDGANQEETEAAEAGPLESEDEDSADLSSGESSAVEDEATENEVNRTNQFLPSALGLTALVRLPKELKVTISAARYQKITALGVGKDDKDGNPQPHHYRQALNLPPLEVQCDDLIGPGAVRREVAVYSTAEAQLCLHILSRPYRHAREPLRDRIVTFTLVNRTPMEGRKAKDGECFFQCGFSVRSSDTSPCFLPYPERPVPSGLHDEEASIALLYRHKPAFAIGHGCAGEWEEDGSAGASLIRTECFPTHEMTPIVAAEVPGLELSMLLLSNPDGRRAIEVCEQLADAYGRWIEEQAAIAQSPDFPPEHKEAALRHVALCRGCLRRIEDGISLLESDTATRQAFAWMNDAMLRQQLHYDVAVRSRRSWVQAGGGLSLQAKFSRPDYASPPSGRGLWRPFQLAFVLMNLRSISSPDHTERDIVDLIWFPTGGGKTEAYLGLTAFSIFRRRLRDPNASGTTVLMRYTLRLLTAQQFQRAASLICACEVIRRANEVRLGATRISAGLWVGQSVTPNDNTSAKASLSKLQKDGKPNQFVLITCPWCGAEFGPVDFANAYQAKGYRRVGPSVIFRCEDPDCDFTSDSGLPLLVIDEAIYHERPTLVIGTADKFALLPWYAGPRRMFGLDEVSPVPPPDLIIQDELHLISGPLGSMVGMYEGTIDALCTRNVGGRTVGPKIVASTATICRADEQVHALYGRSVGLFPPQGLRASESFFASEASGSSAGRLYVGVFATALSSHVTAQVRVLSSLLQAAKEVNVDEPAVVDPYWTLMVYFNSLRELGHAATLIRADIREHLNAQWDRHGIRKPDPKSGEADRRRFINRDLELTSRIASDSIGAALQQLFNVYPGHSEARPVDVCLATNMIQVGLDVSRLGLMAVIGQPKTTSEYIQATSRVGRDVRGPGLVVTILNPGKPRDRSHFEHFRSYHQSIYRWVEPTSVTPFAIPVRERALHSQLVTLLRYWGGPGLLQSPKPPLSEDVYQTVRRLIVERITRIDPGEAEAAGRMLDGFLERWQATEPPIYGHFGLVPIETPLLFPSGSEPRSSWAGRAKATPSSMRSVDASCDAFVISQFPQPDAE